MQTRVQRWGNSLAVRIPKSFAAEIGIAQDSEVEISLVDGKLVLAPLASEPLPLKALLAGISDDNLHAEVGSGEPAGNEIW
jgi:antitoxin MazE